MVLARCSRNAVELDLAVTLTSPKYQWNVTRFFSLQRWTDFWTAGTERVEGKCHD